MEERVQIDPEWKLLIQKARHLGLSKDEVRRFIHDSNGTKGSFKKQQARKVKHEGTN
jgi:transcriptional/translational regulatory protein YebC/TACO1